ncbi:MAG: hypothetical protein ABSB89_09695 [Candidatus Bathyarchaeia archaeon]|jgi:hypothetical protein
MKKDKLKEKGRTSVPQRRVVAAAQKAKNITSPKLREAYSTKIEWITKLIPKLKEETEAPKEKE